MSPIPGGAWVKAQINKRVPYSQLQERMAGVSARIPHPRQWASQAMLRANCYAEGQRMAILIKRDIRREHPEFETNPEQLAHFNRQWDGMGLQIGHLLLSLQARQELTFYRNLPTFAQVIPNIVNVTSFLLAKNLEVHADNVRRAVQVASIDPQAPIRAKWLRDAWHWSANFIWNYRFMGFYWSWKYYDQVSQVTHPIIDRLGLNGTQAQRYMQFEGKPEAELIDAIAARDREIEVHKRTGDISAEMQAGATATLNGMIDLLAFARTVRSDPERTRKLAEFACRVVTRIDDAFVRAAYFKEITHVDAIEGKPRPRRVLAAEGWWIGSALVTKIVGKLYRGKMRLPIDPVPQGAKVDVEMAEDAQKELETLLANAPSEEKDTPEFMAAAALARDMEITPYTSVERFGEGNSVMAKCALTGEVAYRFDVCEISEVPEGAQMSPEDRAKDPNLWLAAYDPIQDRWVADILKRTSGSLKTPGFIIIPGTARVMEDGRVVTRSFVVALDGKGSKEADWKDPQVRARLIRKQHLFKQVTQLLSDLVSNVEYTVTVEAAQAALSTIAGGEATRIVEGTAERIGNGTCLYIDLSGYSAHVWNHQADPEAGPKLMNQVARVITPILRKYFKNYGRPGDAYIEAAVPDERQSLEYQGAHWAFRAEVEIQRALAQQLPHVKLKMSFYPGRLAVCYFGVETDRTLTLGGVEITLAERIASALGLDHLVFPETAFPLLEASGDLTQFTEIDTNQYILRFLLRDYNPHDPDAQLHLFTRIEELYNQATEANPELRARIPLSYFIVAFLHRIQREQLLSGFRPFTIDDLFKKRVLTNLKNIPDPLPVRYALWDRHPLRPIPPWAKEIKARFLASLQTSFKDGAASTSPPPVPNGLPRITQPTPGEEPSEGPSIVVPADILLTPPPEELIVGSVDTQANRELQTLLDKVLAGDIIPAPNMATIPETLRGLALSTYQRKKRAVGDTIKKIGEDLDRLATLPLPPQS